MGLLHLFTDDEPHLSHHRLAKILKCAGNDDTVTLRYSESSDVVTIMFDDQKRDKQQECELKLMDIDMESLGIPEQDYAVKVTMPSAEFSVRLFNDFSLFILLPLQKAIRDLSNFTDSLNIVATKAGLQFQGKGDNGQSALLVMCLWLMLYLCADTIRWGQQGSADGDNDVSIELTEPVTITFAIKYLQNFIKATPLSDRVTLSMSPDVPVGACLAIVSQSSLTLDGLQ